MVADRGRARRRAIGGRSRGHHALLRVADEPARIRRTDPAHAGAPGRRAPERPGEAEDPLGEDHDSAVPGLVHRYPDRVLFLVTNFCAVYCRYCTRARHGRATPASSTSTIAQHQQAIDYIAAHPEIRDVLDLAAATRSRWPTIGSMRCLGRLRAIPHVEFLRIGTKVPAVLPQRDHAEFVAMLKRYHPLWMSIHFIHPNEVTPEVVGGAEPRSPTPACRWAARRCCSRA